MDPEQLMNALAGELSASIREMNKTDDIEERRKHSEIVRNLSESLGVFLQLVSDVISTDFDDFDDDYDEYEE